MTLKTLLLRSYHRLETLRTIAEEYEAKAREARREINLVMSEPILEKIRGMGL